MACLHEYRCWNCGLTMVSASSYHRSCPHCGGSLFFLGVQEVVDPIEDDEITEAMKNIMAGFEKLLG